MDDPHVEVEIKPQLKPKGSVAKEEDLPTSCTSYRLNSHDQLGRLCVYGIYKRSLRGSHKRKRTLIPVTQEKHLLFLFFDLFCSFFQIFLFFSLFSFSTPSVVVVDFIGTMKSN